ncbi:MAG: protein translocase subunit SecD [Planctomycetaceae bacterium]|nr:protein translocase subunit SecD [Planctomycetaceae bacterium]
MTNETAVSPKKTGFRILPLTFVIAMALLAVNFYTQPFAQDQGQDQGAAPAASAEAPAESPAVQATPERSAVEPSVVVTPAASSENSPENQVAPTPSGKTSETASGSTPESAAVDKVPEPAIPVIEKSSESNAAESAAPKIVVPDVKSVSPDDMAKLLEAVGGVSEIKKNGQQTETGQKTSVITKPQLVASEITTVEKTPPVPWYDTVWFSFLLFFAVLTVSWLLANAAAKSWRMPDHSFKFFLILFTTLGSVTATFAGFHRLTLGIDLRGGVVLIYDVKSRTDAVADNQANNKTTTGKASASGDVFPELIRAVNQRINPAGVKEIVVQRYGLSQLKIIIPRADDAEVSRIERIISEAGTLEFRILASRKMPEDAAVIVRAEQQPAAKQVLNPVTGAIEAMWFPINENEIANFQHQDFVTRLSGNRTEILVLKDQFNVQGGNLRNIREGSQMTDEGFRHTIEFSLDSRGAELFAGLTTKFAADPSNPAQTTRFLGIIMSGEMFSAPTIKNPITGGGCSITFSPRAGDQGDKQLQREIKDLLQVMRAGALPADISREPISRDISGATLGEATIRSGLISGLVALSSLFVFMLVYYRFCGVIACLAVTVNFFMIMASMLAIRGAFTLAGIAGLILTLGVAVDANILIFERLREEMRSGSTLKMAIRNAFSRASSAIIDSNVTALITAAILYYVGTEQTKGFAVTLFLGVLFSMYTAVFCGHVVFDVVEHLGLVKRFSMLHLLEKPNFNFMKYRKISVTIFAVLCVLSLLLGFVRGKGLYDIDFVGGVSVEVVFKDQNITQGEIQKTLTGKGMEDLTVAPVQSAMSEKSGTDAEKSSIASSGKHFTINTAAPPDVEATEYLKQVTSILKETYGDKLVYPTMTPTTEERKTPDSKTETIAKIKVDPSMNFKSLDRFLNDHMKRMVESKDIPYPIPFVIASDDADDAAKTSKSFSNWTVTFQGDKATVDKVIAKFREEFVATPWFPASSTIGSIVAGYVQIAALTAIIASWIAIVLYLWLRFHKIYFGLASVLALVNNVIITFGAIALSYWMADFLGFLLIDKFKIGLTVIAAFLTVIGYSINDTIILFDRIREVRGKSTQLSLETINRSINQTLSRTLLTSLSTIFVILVIYTLGGEGLHTFAFTLAVGIIVGTFSSIFLAAPLLFWMVNEPGKTADAKDKAKNNGK